MKFRHGVLIIEMKSLLNVNNFAWNHLPQCHNAKKRIIAAVNANNLTLSLVKTKP